MRSYNAKQKYIDVVYKLRFLVQVATCTNSLYKLQLVQTDLYKLQLVQILDLYKL